MRGLVVPLLWLAVAALATSGCVVKDESRDGLREIEPTVTFATLSRAPDGAATLEFNFHYEMGIGDREGVEEVRWLYSLVDRDRNVLAQAEQQMRKPDLGKDYILVEGDRKRALSVPAGRVQTGETYVLWITVLYREEVLTELLTPVAAL